MPQWVFRVIGTVGALFVSAAALAAVDHVLKKQQAKIDAELADADRAAADGQAQPDAADAAPEKQPDGETAAPQAQPDAADAAPEKQPDGETAAPKTQADGPNPNPVLAGQAAAPHTPDGRVDAAHLCAPEDFSNWEDLGCRG